MRWTYWALAALLFAACGPPKVSEIEGDPRRLEIAGLGNVHSRGVAVTGAGAFVAGYGGSELHGRLMLVDSDGSTTADATLPQLRQPDSVAACRFGDSGAALMRVTEGEGDEATTRVTLATLSATGEVVTQGAHSGGPATVRAADGTACGLCMYEAESGKLACLLEADSEPALWEPGALIDWRVLRAGERIVLVDWGVTGERIIVRIANLAVGEDFAWTQAYDIGRFPEYELLEEGAAVPMFTIEGDHILVTYLDGSGFDARAFYTRLPLDGTEVGEPTQIDTCPRGCIMRWSGLVDGTVWAWFDRNGVDRAVRFDAEEHTQYQFSAPHNTAYLGGGWFKLGLGDGVGDWFAVLKNEL